MAAGAPRRISASSARAHTRRPKAKTSSKWLGIVKKVLLVSLIGFLAWAYQATRPPPPKTIGSSDGIPVTASRIKLKNGRFLAYEEFGVPKDIAKHKVLFIHGFDCCRHDFSGIVANISPDIVESEGLYFVSFDRPGYGESDPNPTQTVKTLAYDIEELADQLGLGSKFYVIGYSMGGQVTWTCLKYIPHRLAGAALLAPVVNYWWDGIPSNLSQEAFGRQLLQDQWALRVAHHLPWLSHWWNTQKHFPGLSLIAHSPKVLSSPDVELVPRMLSLRKGYQTTPRQQGEYVSVIRDLVISFSKWEFDPTDLKNLSEVVPVHVWHGDEDLIIPVTLQRHIVKQLPWIQYHELAGAGHLFPFADGIADSIVRSLLAGNKDLS